MYQEFGATAIVAPWQKNPYQLTSWLEMLEFSAQTFFWCGRALRGLMADCLIGSAPGEPGNRAFVVSREIDDPIRSDAVKTLKGIEAGFREIGLQITADTISDVTNDLETQAEAKALNFQWLMDQIIAIEKLAERELKGKGFFYIPAERTRFFPTANSRTFLETRLPLPFRALGRILPKLELVWVWLEGRRASLI